MSVLRISDLAGRKSGHTQSMDPSAPSCPILIIDDDDDLRAAVQQALMSEGYPVVADASAELALDRLQKTKLRPSLILLDYSLPGMNGAQFLERMRSLSTAYHEVPVILSSADNDLSEKGKALPVNSVLRKPMSLSRLLDEVARTFKEG